MNQENETELRLGERLHRSRGRGSRRFTANARVTEEEQEELERFATASGKTLSEWAREVLLQEARRPQDDPVFTEVVATRMLLNHILRHLAVNTGMTLDEFAAKLDNVRNEKRTIARELRKQYTAEQGKEQ